MIVDLDLSFALRGVDPLGVKDLDLAFSLRPAPPAAGLNFDLDFELLFDEDQSITATKLGADLTYAPLYVLAGGVLIDPVNGGEWSA